MSVRVTIVDGAIAPSDATRAGLGAGAGALLVFEGIVRGTEDGRPIAGLDYTAYEPMASRQMREIADTIVREGGLLGLEATHSRGFVGVGGCSLRVVVWAAHRGEALTAMARFIDLLKRDVPIWKRAVEA